MALGGGGAGRVSASAGRSAQAGAPACGDTARTQPAAHAGRSRQRGVTVRSRLLGPNTRCSGGRGSRAWTRHPVSPCQPPGPPAPRQGLWVLCPLGPPEPAPLGLSTLEEGGSPTPGCRPPQLLLQDQGAHPSDASLPHPHCQELSNQLARPSRRHSWLPPLPDRLPASLSLSWSLPPLCPYLSLPPPSLPSPGSRLLPPTCPLSSPLQREASRAGAAHSNKSPTVTNLSRRSLLFTPGTQ